MKYIKRILLILVICILGLQMLIVKSQNLSLNPETPPNVLKRENLLIIIDSSYSMDEKIDGQKKIEIAKETVNKALSKLSSSVWIGLRVYGHKSDFFGFRACKASELKIPIGPDNNEQIKAEVAKLQPLGWTPITYSLDQALKSDFKNIQGDKRIILVSDGMETCDGSPCEFVVNLAKRNIDLKIDVIGFALNDKAAISQLKCTALVTKGKFYSANNADELTESLIKSLNSSKEVQGLIIK